MRVDSTSYKGQGFRVDYSQILLQYECISYWDFVSIGFRARDNLISHPLKSLNVISDYWFGSGRIIVIKADTYDA